MNLQGYPGPCMTTVPGKSASIIKGIPGSICLRRLYSKKILRLIHPQNHSFILSHSIKPSLEFSNDNKNPSCVNPQLYFFFLPPCHPPPNSLEYDISLSTVHLGSPAFSADNNGAREACFVSCDFVQCGAAQQLE